MMKSNYKSVVILLTLPLLGCGISEVDLVGTWTLTPAAREALPQDIADAAGKLSLRANGTFMASELPLDWMGSELVKISGVGEWFLGRVGSHTVELIFNSIGDGIPTSSGTTFSASRFDGLVYYRGDPDDGDWIYYERVEVGPGG